MRIKKLGNNETLMVYNDGTEILFSYETPVAGRTHNGYFRTDKNFSVTTSRHINKYLEGRNATIVDQQSIEELVKC